MKTYFNKDTSKLYYEGSSITHKAGNSLFSGVPTEEQLEEWGYAELVSQEVEPTPPTEEELQQRYVLRVRELIREKYAIEDELAIQRQRYTDPDKFNEYNDFCEVCKQKAREEIFS